MRSKRKSDAWRKTVPCKLRRNRRRGCVERVKGHQEELGTMNLDSVFWDVHLVRQAKEERSPVVTLQLDNLARFLIIEHCSAASKFLPVRLN